MVVLIHLLICPNTAMLTTKIPLFFVLRVNSYDSGLYHAITYRRLRAIHLFILIAIKCYAIANRAIIIVSTLRIIVI